MQCSVSPSRTFRRDQTHTDAHTMCAATRMHAEKSYSRTKRVLHRPRIRGTFLSKDRGEVVHHERSVRGPCVKTSEKITAKQSFVATRSTAAYTLRTAEGNGDFEAEKENARRTRAFDSASREHRPRFLISKQPSDCRATSRWRNCDGTPGCFRRIGFEWVDPGLTKTRTPGSVRIGALEVDR
jgi:hypothetical protein